MSMITVTGGNMSDTNRSVTLGELNAERRLLLLPVIAVFCVVMAIGIIGNLLAINVYGRRYQMKAAILFMIILAATDLLSCSICLPFEIYDTANPFLNHFPILCKLFRFIEAFSNTYSGLILVCIAFDRFHNTRYPLKMSSLEHSKSLAAVMCALAVAIAWPMLLLSGNKTIRTRIDGVTGIDCSTSDMMYHSVYSLLFQGCLSLLFSICFIVFVVFYGLIALTVCNRSCRTIGAGVSYKQPTMPVSPMRRKRFEQMLIARALSSMKTPIGKTRSNIGKIHLRPGHTTMMLSVITFSGIIGYVPYLTAEFLHFSGQKFQEDMSSTEVIIYKICNNSYFLSNAMNPIIYSILSPHFRRESVVCLKRIFRCK
ncbi:cholecystokinin receptor type A-like [Haliotis rufescens]|uniref:cholecystokinin receptor type A-like n=1 Tax=Haliotis rufescens TaxID=6454 RepID=UPI00201EFECE|nr:cholecystokinin receptor type A-like [Haliotis rufescens]